VAPPLVEQVVFGSQATTLLTAQQVLQALVGQVVAQVTHLLELTQ
jgi:hypothetical protein